MKRKKERVFQLAALLMVLLIVVTTASAQGGNSKGAAYDLTEVDNVAPLYSKSEGVLGEVKGATGLTTYIIQLVDPPLASYRGDIDGLEATNPGVRGELKLDVNSPASIAYESYLAGKHADFLGDLENLIGRSIEVSFDYTVALNGLAAILTPEEAAAALNLPSVRQIQRDFERYIDTDYGPTWIGAPGIWNGTTTGGLPGTYGEGMVAGIIDTGVNMSHPSFADIGGDGYDHTNPLGAGNYLGLCDTNPGTYVCNDKLIGYYIFTGETTEDTDGHGSNVASITAGNVISPASMFISATINIPPIVSTINPLLYEEQISGVAPHANIISYDGCTDTGGCPGSALIAAINQATADAVDVINYSIGGGPSNPWGDADALAFLAAVDAGVLPVTSAGNNGPGPATLGSPGDAPWLMTVGATTHNRAFPNAIINMTGGDTAPPADMDGQGWTGGTGGPLPIVYAGDFGDPLCGTPFPAGTWTNDEIVVCDRGTYARVEKGVYVLAGGAGGYILANSDAGQSLNADAHALPAVHIDYDSGVALKTWLSTGTGHMATIAGSTLSVAGANADKMAGFSSRGPNPSVSDIIKPDVATPGIDILGAYKTGNFLPDNFQSGFGFVSGTSQASPHTAGAAILMKDLYPALSPTAIKAMLMSTGWTTVLKEDGSTPADPFDIGAGRVDLSAAGETGLALDETVAAFTAANPAAGGDPKTLNLASMANSQCLNSCEWTRNVFSVLDGTVSYQVSATGQNGMVITVSPDNFVLAAGADQDLTITADVSGATTGSWIFGEVVIAPVPADNGEAVSQISEVHLPVAVIGAVGVLPEKVELETRRSAGSTLLEDLQAAEITDLTLDPFGFAEATITEELLSQDPTNGDPYDNLNDGTTFFITTTVAAGDVALVAEVFASTAEDIDLFVGTGDTPSAATEQCASTTSSWQEFCEILDPAAGTWWVLVQNWTESASPPDPTSLATAVVGGDAGNMSFEGPSSVPSGTPFDLRVFWNAPDMAAGDRYYGYFDIGSSAGSPGDIGRVPVFVYRVDDDVAKVASTGTAQLGETVSYTITVQPNVREVDLTYTITDTIPAGMTYVPSSATASAGVVDVNGGILTWSGVMPVPGFTYDITTSGDGSGCAMPLANSGAYTDLEGYGLSTNSGISGDSVTYSVDFSGGAFNLFGDYWGELLYFTDDGFAFFDPSEPGPTPWNYEPIPTAGSPDNLLAAFWRDFEIVYDGPTNRGVTIANLTSSGVPVGGLVEYDDVEDYPAGTNPTYDLELLAYYDPSDARPEIIFAYDNLTGAVADGTIGVENWNGTFGVQYAYDNIDVTNGMAICFDLTEAGVEPAVITYDVTIDEDATCPATHTNMAEHQTDNPGSLVGMTSVDVIVSNCVPTDVSMADFSAQQNSASVLPLILALVVVALGGVALSVTRRRTA